MSDGSHFQGLEIELHRWSGVRVLRVVHPGSQAIDEHRHDWAYIGIYTLGRYQERYDGGEADMRGPSVALHPANRPHADLVGDAGLETLTIEFDPAWLRRFGFHRQLDRSRIWQGGLAALHGQKLAEVLQRRVASEAELGAATVAFLGHALGCEEIQMPAWLSTARLALEKGVGSTAEISRQLDLHPAWLARAYRHSAGEGLHETVRRLRVERASRLLRRSEMPLADIAIASGFCDQSHMNRCFRGMLGRTPIQVRSERAVGS